MKNQVFSELAVFMCPVCITHSAPLIKKLFFGMMT